MTTALGQLGLSAGRKARLHRILYQHDLRNGTALFLLYEPSVSPFRWACRGRYPRQSPMTRPFGQRPGRDPAIAG
jgi:hypothetical protein